jgi:type I restriction enzyme S subunit
MREARLGDFLVPALDPVPIEPEVEYHTAGVLSHGKGLFARPIRKGNEISYSTYYRLHANQLVYSRLFAWEGALAVVPEQFDGFFVSQEFPTFDIDSTKALPPYVALLINRPDLWHRLSEVVSGMGGRRKRVHPAALVEVFVPVTPLAEQRRIIDLLAAIDAMVAAAARLAAQADTAVRSARREVLESFPKRVRLAEVLSLHRGYDLPAQDRREGTALVIASNGPVGTHDTAMVRGPGVITGRSGTIGRVFMAVEDFWPLNTTLFVEDFKGNDPGFVRHLLVDLELERFAGGSTVPSLNRNVLDSQLVAVPTIERQRWVVALLDSLEREAECAGAIARRATELRRAVLDGLLSGNHEIPTSYDRFLESAA